MKCIIYRKKSMPGILDSASDARMNQNASILKKKAGNVHEIFENKNLDKKFNFQKFFTICTKTILKQLWYDGS